jgi:hypothetical protein
MKEKKSTITLDVLTHISERKDWNEIIQRNVNPKYNFRGNCHLSTRKKL